MKFELLSVLLVVLIGGAFLTASVMGAWSSRNETGLQRWLIPAGWSLVAVGASGFFGMAFLAVGGLRWWSANFEWPVGFARGILTLPNGIRVVPHTPTGRVQVYGANWSFQRGWFVDAGAGTFKLILGSSNRLEVITARGQMRYVYDLGGQLLTSESYSPRSYGDFPASPQAAFVPTPWWQWIFTGPFYSWGVMALGGGILFAAEKIKRRAKKTSKPTNS